MKAASVRPFGFSGTATIAISIWAAQEAPFAPLSASSKPPFNLPLGRYLRLTPLSRNLLTDPNLRGDLEAQINYARQAIAVGGRVYPVGHRYWRDCHGQYLRTVLSQVEKYLQRARKNRARAGAWGSDLKQAKDLLSELDEVPNLSVLTKSERPWIEWLNAAVAFVETDDDAKRQSLTEAVNKVAAIESRSSSWKKRAQVANEFLAGLAIEN